jgi:hypothetical protein
MRNFEKNANLLDDAGTLDLLGMLELVFKHGITGTLGKRLGRQKRRLLSRRSNGSPSGSVVINT